MHNRAERKVPILIILAKQEVVSSLAGVAAEAGIGT
jgi:hypothetical protein